MVWIRLEKSGPEVEFPNDLNIYQEFGHYVWLKDLNDQIIPLTPEGHPVTPFRKKQVFYIELQTFGLDTKRVSKVLIKQEKKKKRDNDKKKKRLEVVELDLLEVEMDSPAEPLITAPVPKKLKKHKKSRSLGRNSPQTNNGWWWSLFSWLFCTCWSEPEEQPISSKRRHNNHQSVKQRLQDDID